MFIIYKIILFERHNVETCHGASHDVSWHVSFFLKMIFFKNDVGCFGKSCKFAAVFLKSEKKRIIYKKFNLIL